jgi:phenylacetic acid degradation operon negative regulatory protein
VSDTDGLDVRPLTARSVILSVLLGTHPPFLPVRSLVRTAELFGISEGTTRVALSRLAADGDVAAEGGEYSLTARLAERQARQDEAVHPKTRDWTGAWELVIADPVVHSAAERAALGSDLEALRLAPLRPGVWARPDNLVREWPGSLDGRAMRFIARPEPHGATAALEGIWDLAGWASTAERLTAGIEASSDPAEGFTLAAAIVRHLQQDPMLPAELLPDRWPGDRMRAAYGAYEGELREILRRERARHI